MADVRQPGKVMWSWSGTNMGAKLNLIRCRLGIITTVMSAEFLRAVAATGAAAQTRPESSVIKSARTVSSLVQTLILAVFLLLLFIFMVSLLVAVRRIMLARRREGHEKTAHIDAWTIAGQRMKTDTEDKSDDDSHEQSR
jgi:uncharacterized membrane protein